MKKKCIGDLLQQIKSRITIVDILDQFEIPHKRSRTKCPLHNGHNPTSFSFNDKTFHCFSCGVKGDVFDFVRFLKNCDFKEAVRFLADYTGIPVLDKEFHNVRERLSKVDSGVALKSIQEKLYKTKIDAVQTLQDILVRQLQNLEKDFRSGKIAMVDYYTKKPLLENNLEYLDELELEIYYEAKGGIEDVDRHTA